ncbi:MAG: chemotaxis protein CheW [Cyanobacteria bacterium P01_H01_bin.26]
MDNNIPTLTKFITFQAASHWFALSMASILRIVNCPPPDQGGIVTLGVVQLGSHTIQLLDLHGIFGVGTHGTLPEQVPFLLVLQSDPEKLWGIALESPPDLIELPLTAFQSVSSDKNFFPRKQWISHIAVVSEPDVSRTLLLLDLEAVFSHEHKAMAV